MHRLRAAARPLAVLGGILLVFAIAAPVLAHEERDINGYSFAVGFIDEPVFVGDKSGLEFFVNKDNQPVADLEKTITAQVIYGPSMRDLPITADDDVAGRYFSAFIPTAAGKYTFHLKGTLPDGSSFDQSFTSSPTGFNEVQEVASGQFPIQFPSQAELAAQARQGADAAGQVTIALGLGAVGVVLGLLALGVAVASRSRAR
jgi:hypothetical protein